MVKKTLLSNINKKDSDLEMLLIQLFQTRKAEIRDSWEPHNNLII